MTTTPAAHGPTAPPTGTDWNTHVSIGASALVGALVLLVADIGLKNQASAFKQILHGVSTQLDVALPPWLLALLLLTLAVALCFIFEQRNTKGAFYTGASLFSIMATLTPTTGGGLSTSPEIAGVHGNRLAVPTLLVGLAAPVIAAQAPAPNGMGVALLR